MIGNSKLMALFSYTHTQKDLKFIFYRQAKADRKHSLATDRVRRIEAKNSTYIVDTEMSTYTVMEREFLCNLSKSCDFWLNSTHAICTFHVTFGQMTTNNQYEISKLFSRLSLDSLLVSLGVIYWDRWPRRAALQTTKSPIIGVPSSMYLTHHI